LLNFQESASEKEKKDLLQELAVISYILLNIQESSSQKKKRDLPQKQA
jgi:hypothetical protein